VDANFRQGISLGELPPLPFGGCIETFGGNPQSNTKSTMCEGHRELLTAYREAIATLSSALDALEAARPTTGRAEYQRMAKRVDEAQAASEKAKVALEKHTREHGCFPTMNASGTAG